MRSGVMVTLNLQVFGILFSGRNFHNAPKLIPIKKFHRPQMVCGASIDWENTDRGAKRS